jgi:hypothetical protein
LLRSEPGIQIRRSPRRGTWGRVRGVVKRDTLSSAVPAPAPRLAQFWTGEARHGAALSALASGAPPHGGAADHPFAIAELRSHAAPAEPHLTLPRRAPPRRAEPAMPDYQILLPGSGERGGKNAKIPLLVISRHLRCYNSNAGLKGGAADPASRRLSKISILPSEDEIRDGAGRPSKACYLNRKQAIYVTQPV